MDEILQHAQLNFNDAMQGILNICLAIIMFGVALSLKFSQFKVLFQKPKAFLVGVVSQYIMLPVLTMLLICILHISPMVAMGMVLIASCPGGNVSNFFSHLAKGDVALSILLSLFSTLGAVFLTPLQIMFWTAHIPGIDTVFHVEISFLEMGKSIGIILLLPVILAITFTRFFPEVSQKIQKPFRWVSFVILIGFVIGALVPNWALFKEYILTVIPLVILHNFLALGGGYGLGRLFRLKKDAVKSVSIETGIQNTGLGLVLIFTFFDGSGPMALMAACWGIWHLVSGSGIAYMWSLRNKKGGV